MQAFNYSGCLSLLSYFWGNALLLWKSKLFALALRTVWFGLAQFLKQLTRVSLFISFVIIQPASQPGQSSQLELVQREERTLISVTQNTSEQSNNNSLRCPATSETTQSRAEQQQQQRARMMDTSSVPLMMDVEGGEENIDNKPRLEDDFAFHNNVAGASKHVRLGEDRQRAV